MKLQQQIDMTPPIHQDLSQVSTDGYVVGVDIGGTNLRMALADRTGTVITRWGASTVGVRGAHLIVDLIRTGVDHLFQQAPAPRNSLRAIAAGVPGTTNVDTGVVIATSYLMGWRDIPLRDLLQAALGVPATVDNDVNTAAIGESWLGAAKDTRDFVFLAIGTGIGAGIILNGQPFRGMGWSAGEIGYMLVPGAPEEPVERGKPGPLESIIGGEGIRIHWNELWRETNTSLPRDLTATQIFDHALEGDVLAQTILQHAAKTLAYAISNISLILNCSLFVFGGGVGMHAALADATSTILEQRGTRIRPRLTHSILGEDAQLTGTIRLALDTANAHAELSSPAA
jgi:glucokinase